MNDDNRERRYRYLDITDAILDTEDGLIGLVAALRKLPPDARIVRVIEDLRVADDCKVFRFRVWSQAYDPVEHGGVIPRVEVQLDWRAVEQARRFLRSSSTGPAPGECICDMEYTGLKHHKSGCPKR